MILNPRVCTIDPAAAAGSPLPRVAREPKFMVVGERLKEAIFEAELVGRGLAPAGPLPLLEQTLKLLRAKLGPAPCERRR